jgi:hypothetical protein
MLNMLSIKLFQFNKNIKTVSVLKQNNQNKRFVSDSAETSFGSSFGFLNPTSFEGQPVPTFP